MNSYSMGICIFAPLNCPLRASSTGEGGKHKRVVKTGKSRRAYQVSTIIGLQIFVVNDIILLLKSLQLALGLEYVIRNQLWARVGYVMRPYVCCESDLFH